MRASLPLQPSLPRTSSSNDGSAWRSAAGSYLWRSSSASGWMEPVLSRSSTSKTSSASCGLGYPSCSIAAPHASREITPDPLRSTRLRSASAVPVHSSSHRFTRPAVSMSAILLWRPRALRSSREMAPARCESSAANSASVSSWLPLCSSLARPARNVSRVRHPSADSSKDSKAPSSSPNVSDRSLWSARSCAGSAGTLSSLSLAKSSWPSLPPIPVRGRLRKSKMVGPSSHAEAKPARIRPSTNSSFPMSKLKCGQVSDTDRFWAWQSSSAPTSPSFTCCGACIKISFLAFGSASSTSGSTSWPPSNSKSRSRSA
mmetsp:Transcript_6846/g.19186  ORF Transcript_6846/g.19186 Transcript_6846/m.19186 type:complete len:316 (-) Transcript_6846:46-993(-)